MSYATATEDRPVVYDLQRNDQGVFEYRTRRPDSQPRVTSALLVAMAAGFFLQLLAPGLTGRFAVDAVPVASGEWWRLLTGAFLHGGVLHLAANAWFSWVLGSRLERAIGPVRLLAVTLIAMLGSSLLVVAAGGAAVGFSGVLYGWLAAWLAFHLTTRFPTLRMGTLQWRSFMQLLFANLLLSLLPGISFSGHLGGFVAGFAVALLLGKQRGRPARFGVG